MRKQLKAKNSCKNQSEKKDREISSPRDENITTLRKEDESRKSKRRKKQANYFEISRISTVLKLVATLALFPAVL